MSKVNKPIKTSAQLKKELDRLFSLWIRAKYPKECYTCGKKGGTLQNGHFIPRNILITRWDEGNCRPQCVGCNLFGNGKVLDFEDHLVKDFGRKVVDKLKASRFTIMKVDSVWYEKQIEHYKKELSTVLDI